MKNKKITRKHMREKRFGLDEQVQAEAGLAVLAQLKQYPVFLAAKRTALYLANGGELPLSAVASHLWRRKQACLLPVIFSSRQRKIYFSDYHKKTHFLTNQYGVLEPAISVRQQVKPMCLNVILMPLVAFDGNGNRLGMGGGYYDQSFAFLKRRSSWKKPCLIGVAYDFQEVDILETEPWDVPLDVIVTPTRLIKYS